MGTASYSLKREVNVIYVRFVSKNARDVKITRLTDFFYQIKHFTGFRQAAKNQQKRVVKMAGHNGPYGGVRNIFGMQQFCFTACNLIYQKSGAPNADKQFLVGVVNVCMHIDVGIVE